MKHVFSGVPKILNRVSREKTESPSLERVAGKTGISGDPNILSVISSVSGMICPMYIHDTIHESQDPMPNIHE